MEKVTPATKLNATRATCQPDCLATRPREQGGLGLHFEVLDDGSVQAAFGCDAAYQSYPDRLHGGIVATLLDSAMTNCLFARGVSGVTARLNIRYRHPVEIGQPVEVQAWLDRDAKPLYVLRSELRQAGVVMALADAKFYGAPVPAETGEA